MDGVDNFQIIAEEIVAVCGENFESAVMDGKVDENYMDHSITCINSDGIATSNLLASSQRRLVFNELTTIRDEMAADDQEKWTGYRFEINKNGTFKFNVTYGDWD